MKVQEIAVFGESGSGKTVLLSSFYGATQEPSFGSENSYLVIADDMAQSASLKQIYLRMPCASGWGETPALLTFALHGARTDQY